MSIVLCSTACGASQRLRVCSLGMTRAWPRVHGLMSMKAIVLSSSSILCAGISPATILQKRQSGSAIGAEPSDLEPIDAAEELVQHDCSHEHRRDRTEVSVVPAQLGHVAE